MDEATKRASEAYDQLSEVCNSDASLKGQKATRAIENYSWNIRLLKLQHDLMAKSIDEATRINQQVLSTQALLCCY